MNTNSISLRPFGEVQSHLFGSRHMCMMMVRYDVSLELVSGAALRNSKNAFEFDYCI